MDATLVAIARLLNLLVPGAGLILIGRLLSGWSLALGFAITANLAVLFIFVIPVDINPAVRSASIGSAALLYVAAQGLFASAVRFDLQAAMRDQQSRVLRSVHRLIAAGDWSAAWQELQPLLPTADGDLLIALRAAQILTVVGDRAAAAAACEDLRRLDKHHICRADLAQLAQQLAARPSNHNLTAADAVASQAGR